MIVFLHFRKELDNTFLLAPSAFPPSPQNAEGVGNNTISSGAVAGLQPIGNGWTGVATGNVFFSLQITFWVTTENVFFIFF